VRRLSSGRKDVGRLLLSRAAAFSADLIVMGATPLASKASGSSRGHAHSAARGRAPAPDFSMIAAAGCARPKAVISDDLNSNYALV